MTWLRLCVLVLGVGFTSAGLLGSYLSKPEISTEDELQVDITEVAVEKPKVIVLETPKPETKPKRAATQTSKPTPKKTTPVRKPKTRVVPDNLPTGNLIVNPTWSNPITNGWQKAINIRTTDAYNRQVGDQFGGINWAKVDDYGVLKIHHDGNSNIDIWQDIEVFSHQLTFSVSVRLRAAGYVGTFASSALEISYLDKSRQKLGRNVIEVTASWEKGMSTGMSGKLNLGAAPPDGPKYRHLYYTNQALNGDYTSDWAKYDLDVEYELDTYLVGVDPKKVYYVRIWFHCGSVYARGEKGIAEMWVKDVQLKYSPDFLRGRGIEVPLETREIHVAQPTNVNLKSESSPAPKVSHDAVKQIHPLDPPRPIRNRADVLAVYQEVQSHIFANLRGQQEIQESLQKLAISRLNNYLNTVGNNKRQLNSIKNALKGSVDRRAFVYRRDGK